MIKPLTYDEWDEKAEIGKALQEFEAHAQLVSDAIQYAEVEAALKSGRKSTTGILSVHCNLLRELRSTFERKNDFLLQIGYFKAAPMRVILGKEEISDINGMDRLDKEIAELEKLAKKKLPNVSQITQD